MGKEIDAERHIQEQFASKSEQGSFLRQLVLGGQDGVVNTLGLILGVASATGSSKIVLIAGLAGAFAESISMLAVAYTSARAAQDHYNAMREKEKREIKEIPKIEKEEVRYIYKNKGFSGKQLEQIVDRICADENMWIETMMKDELGLTESERLNPMKEAGVVGISALVGSAIPIVPFFLLPVAEAVIASLIASTAVIFIAGALKAKLTIGHPIKSGLEMAAVAMFAALVGYALGAWMGVALS